MVGELWRGRTLPIKGHVAHVEGDLQDWKPMLLEKLAHIRCIYALWSFPDISYNVAASGRSTA